MADLNAILPYLTDEADDVIAARLSSSTWTPKRYLVDFTELCNQWGIAKASAFRAAMKVVAGGAAGAEAAVLADGLLTMLQGRGLKGDDPQVTEAMLTQFVALGGGTITLDDAHRAVWQEVAPAVPDCTAADVAAARVEKARLDLIATRKDDVSCLYAWALNVWDGATIPASLEDMLPMFRVYQAALVGGG